MPIPESVLAPLVEQILTDYRCADLLFRLPGAIPIPSFFPNHPVPAPSWVDLETSRFKPEVVDTLSQAIDSIPLCPSVPFPSGKSKPVGRQVKQAPLLVRHPTPDVDRAQLLDYIGVPASLHAHKVLIVSFGGQVIKRPTGTRTPSRAPSPNYSPPSGTITLQTTPTPNGRRPGHHRHSSSVISLTPAITPSDSAHLHAALTVPPRIATPSHIYVPGAPPASNPSSPMLASAGRMGSTGTAFASFFTPPTPAAEYAPGMAPLAPGAFVEATPKKDTLQPTPHLLPTPDDSAAGSPTDPFAPGPEEELEELGRLLPDGWIAVVCGVAKNWGEEDLPENFFVAPRDVYMPDVTAVGDVLLGKLGYGTCAECVDSCTPFVYGTSPLVKLKPRILIGMGL